MLFPPLKPAYTSPPTPSGSTPTGFATNSVYLTFFILPVNDKNSTLSTILDLMALTIFGEGKNYDVPRYAVFVSLLLPTLFQIIRSYPRQC